MARRRSDTVVAEPTSKLAPWAGLGEDRWVKRVNIHEAKAQLSRLLEEVERGERVEIARRGEPVAVLVPCKAAVRKRRLGLFAGEATMHADFDELPPSTAASSTE